MCPSLAASPRLSDEILSWCDRHRGWLLLAVLALYALAFNSDWRPQPDSALHLTIARNLVEGHGFTHPTGHEVRVNPGLAWLTAATMLVVGTDQLWLANALMMVLGLGALVAAYRLFECVADRPTAVLLTTLLAISLTFFGHTLLVLTDIPFLLGGLVFLLGWARWAERGRLHWHPVALMVAGAAIMVMFRTVAITFLGAVGLALVGHAWRHRRSRGVQVACGGVVVLVTAGLALAALTSSGLSGAAPPLPGASDAAARASAEPGEPPAAISLESHPTDDLELIRQRLARLDTAVTEDVPRNLARMISDNLAVAAFGVDFAPRLNIPLGLAVLVAALTLVRRQPLWALVILAFIVQMLLFLSERRYFLAILPLLLAGWWQATLWLEARLPRTWAKWAVVVMLVLWAVPNTVRSVDQMLEQWQRPYLASLSDGKYEDYHRLAEALRAHVEPGGLVVGETPSGHGVVIFWSHRPVISAGAFDRLSEHRGPLYVLTPIGDALEGLIEREDWGLGEALFEVEPRHLEQPAWTLRRVREREGEREAGVRTRRASGGAIAP